MRNLKAAYQAGIIEGIRRAQVRALVESEDGKFPPLHLISAAGDLASGRDHRNYPLTRAGHQAGPPARPAAYVVHSLGYVQQPGTVSGLGRLSPPGYLVERVPVPPHARGLAELPGMLGGRHDQLVPGPQQRRPPGRQPGRLPAVEHPRRETPLDLHPAAQQPRKRPRRDQAARVQDGRTERCRLPVPFQ